MYLVNNNFFVMSLFDFFLSPEERFEKNVTKAFESVIYLACHDAAGNNFTTDDRVLYAIKVAYEATLESEKLFNESGMSKNEYDSFVKKVMDKVGRKHIRNWDIKREAMRN